MKSKRITLNFWETIGHYSIVLLLLFISAIYFFYLLRIWLDHDDIASASIIGILMAGSVFLLAAIVVFDIKRKQLLFTKIEGHIDHSDAVRAIHLTAHELNWATRKTKENSFEFCKYEIAWRETIRIIIEPNVIFFNSISDPKNFSSLTSLGFAENKKNLNLLVTNLKVATNELADHAPVLESQWTFKKTIFRLFAYPLCLGLIPLGVYAIIHPINFRSPYAGLGGIVIAVKYLYSDLMTIFKKTKAYR
jgi:hypothetical protein